MRFLVIGLGSLGKRRIRNLKYLQSGTIIGCDPRLDRRDETSQRYRIQTFEDFTEAMSHDPEALIISVPASMRLFYALEAAAANKHFFVEVCPKDGQMTELITWISERKIVAAPSCTLCFYPGPKKIRKLLHQGIIGQPLTFTYHCGQYLPGWHPAEDYWPFSDSRPGSTAYREIISFELAWLSSLLGGIEAICTSRRCVSRTRSGADAAASSYHLLLRFRNGVCGHLLLNPTSKAPIQHMHFVGREGIIDWNNSEQLIKIYSTDNTLKHTEPLIRGCVENMYINPEEPYIDELRCFLEAVHGISPFPYTFEQHQNILTLLDQADDIGQEERELIHEQAEGGEMRE
ncbi:MAG: Gfo/Idh/MocA family oxidoreductase [bacterium]